MFRGTTPNRKRLVVILLLSLWLQVITPPVMAAPRGPSPFGALVSNARNLTARLAIVEQSLIALLRASLKPQENWNVVLTPVTTEFKDFTGLDYHASSRKLLLSANTPAGMPNNFEAIAADGTRAAFSNVAGLDGELLIATSRDEGQGMSRGGFPAGELFASTGVAGVIARVNASGATVQNPWVTLPGETGSIGGLYLDRTGIYGGDVLVV